MAELMTIKELSEYLKVTRQTIYVWRKQGMPHIKIAGTVRFDKGAVMHWINNNQK